MEPIKYKARYYPGDSGQALAAEITLLDDGYLEIACPEYEPLRVMLNRMELDVGGHAEDRVKLTCPDTGMTIVCDDRRLVTALTVSSDLKMSHQANMAKRKMGGFANSGLVYWTKVILISGVSLTLLYFLVDYCAVSAISNVDPKTEAKFGSLFAKSDKAISSGPEFDRVNRIGKRLVSHLSSNPYTFNFYVKDDDSVNACAFPGGTVFVNTGLLKKASSDDEVAGVMGHEIGHVIHRDTLKRMAHSIGVWAILQLLLGFSSPQEIDKIASALSFAGDLESKQYGRSAESQADVMSVKLAVDSDYKPDAFINFFERLQKDPESKDNKMFALLSSHPMNEERINTIKAEITRLAPYIKEHTQKAPASGESTTPKLGHNSKHGSKHHQKTR